MLHRLCLTTLIALLLSALSVVAPTGSVALPPQVSVRADEVHLALDRSRTVELDFPAQHAAVYWRGHPGAAVQVAFSVDGETYGAWRDAGRDEVGEQRGDGTTYGAVLTADDARWVRVRSDRPLARVSVLGMRDAAPGAAQETTPRPAAAASADTSQPPVRSRAEWGADESLRSGSPSFAPVRKLIVHHTATSNSYSSRAEAESQIRAILRYHTVTQRWSDIGYNFLIDKFGTIYEGRWSRVYVGTDPSGDNLAGEGVVGAHTGGWNTGSMGVAMLGTHTNRGITRAARRSLVRLLAWSGGPQRHRPHWYARATPTPAAATRSGRTTSPATATTRPRSAPAETSTGPCRGCVAPWPHASADRRRAGPHRVRGGSCCGSGSSRSASWASSTERSRSLSQTTLKSAIRATASTMTTTVMAAADDMVSTYFLGCRAARRVQGNE